MEGLLVGKIVNTFGIRGQLKVKVYTDFVEERFKQDDAIYLGDDFRMSLIVEKSQMHKGMLLLKFKGLDNINDVIQYRDLNLYVDKSTVEVLEEGFYFHELVDMEVYDTDNNLIGKVKEVEENLAHNNLRITKPDNTTCLIPYVDAFIMDVDADENKITVKLIEGLI